MSHCLFAWFCWCSVLTFAPAATFRVPSYQRCCCCCCCCVLHRQLISHYHDECDGLCCRLKRNVEAQASATEIDPRHIQLGGELGSGEFGVCAYCMLRALLCASSCMPPHVEYTTGSGRLPLADSEGTNCLYPKSPMPDCRWWRVCCCSLLFS